MLHQTRALTVAAAAGALFWSASAFAATDATGIWFDHNGKGAVEISSCANGKGLCGYVVNVTDPKNASRCGLQILGNVTPDGGGWIYSPDRGKKYSVELSRLSDDKLRVVGNAGSFFSKTFTWKRAPDDIARCGEQQAAAPAKAETAKTETPKSAPAAAAAPARIENAAVTGASSASMALLATPPVKRQEVVRTAVTEDAQPAAKAADPAPAVAEKAAPAPEAKKAPPAPETTADDEDFKPKRDCKFKIPYVGRVINVPCRD
jgi:uncharacterized protein (DUF2147 family)